MIYFFGGICIVLHPMSFPEADPGGSVQTWHLLFPQSRQFFLEFVFRNIHNTAIQRCDKYRGLRGASFPAIWKPGILVEIDVGDDPARTLRPNYNENIDVVVLDRVDLSVNNKKCCHVCRGRSGKCHLYVKSGVYRWRCCADLSV